MRGPRDRRTPSRLVVAIAVALGALVGACYLNEASNAPSAPASGAVPSANAAGHGRQTICTPGLSCNESCSEGGCGITCQQGSSCNQTCSGGNCAQSCEVGAACTFSCSGGYCLQRCTSQSCRTSCTGRGCTLETGVPPEKPAEQAPPPAPPPAEPTPPAPQ